MKSDPNQAESFCVEGEIQLTAGDVTAATESYLHAHIADGHVTKQNVQSLTEEQKSSIIRVLHSWLKSDDDSSSSSDSDEEERKPPPAKATPDQLWELVFVLKPESLTTCLARIEPLMRDEKYQKVSESCTAILKQYPQDTTLVLLQRALARTLLGSCDKDAIADYLRAYLKDKEVTIDVVRTKQHEHKDKIDQLMFNCIYSSAPAGAEAKAHKQWLALTIDCCRFLLTFDPDDFDLQMTFVERLQRAKKTDKAKTILTDMIRVLQLKSSDSTTGAEHEHAAQLSRTHLRRATCHIARQHVDDAIADVAEGLNVGVRRAAHASDVAFVDDVAATSDACRSAKQIFGGSEAALEDLYQLLDKAAIKIVTEDRFKPVTKVENIRTLTELYRAMLVLQPSNKDALFKLANCLTKLDRTRDALVLFDKILSDQRHAQDADVLSARAACYRELGDKDAAQKDYDALLRNNPKDATLLCDRAIMHIEDNNVEAAVDDLMNVYKINQKTVVTQLGKGQLLQRTKLRQALFDYVKNLLHESTMLVRKGQRADVDSVDDVINNDENVMSVGLAIAQLLTRLNTADQSAHILLAHAMFHAGCTNDAETKLKKMLQDSPAIDGHVIKLHLGLMKIFTGRADEGMNVMLEVLAAKGDRIVSALLRDIPVSERASLADSCHQYGIDILRKERHHAAVNHALASFTLAILCCRGTDLVLEDASLSGSHESDIIADSDKTSEIFRPVTTPLKPADSLPASNTDKPRLEVDKIFNLSTMHSRRLNGGTGVYRSYLARAECMANLGDQRGAILDFSAAIEINALCVEGFCGRAFMRLALGDETDCVNDVTCACDLDMHLVTSHINGLPDEARKLLLYWIDRRVVVLLLNYGYRSTSVMRIGTGGSASTVSVLDETMLKPGHEGSRRSSLSSIHEVDLTPPQRQQQPQERPMPRQEEQQPQEEGQEPAEQQAAETSGGEEQTEAGVTSETAPEEPNSAEAETNKNLHKSSSKDLKEVLLSLDSVYNHEKLNAKEANNPAHHNDSRLSTATTTTSRSTYDDIMTGMEREDLIHKAVVLGKLLITIDSQNTAWHGMFADILIVKGDLEEALRHLQVVMDLSPNDVTAVARSGLINVKLNRYKSACRLLSALTTADPNGLLYVLKALDPNRRRRLAEESLGYAEAFSQDLKYAIARDYYSLSLVADSSRKIELLRMRTKCSTKCGDTGKAIHDITDVIKEQGREAQVNDYYVRANIYWMEGKELHACKDLDRALKINRQQTLTLMHVKPGKSEILKLFCRQATSSFGKSDFGECAWLCEVGLGIDEHDLDLRKLRARAKRESSSCALQ